MSEHNDPKSPRPFGQGRQAEGYQDDHQDTIIDADEPYSDSSQDYSQDNGYDPLSDDLFAQDDTADFSSEDKQTSKSKWMILVGVILVALALILALRLLGANEQAAQIQTPPEPVQVQQAPAASDELALLPTQIELPMPTNQQQRG